ncbi:hypothetical protein C0J52_01188 [Blattella germanica]|nr:hypothetical protein C0J52_01188 [Blattella germanica]
MNNNNLHVLDFVLYGFHGKEDGKREKDSLYLQETVETGVEDGLATSCKVTSLEEDEDEFYDSVDRVVVNELGRETVSSLKFSGENVKQVEDFVAGTLNTTRSLKIQDVAIEDEIEDHEIPEIIDESPLTDPEERGLDNYASEGEAGGFSDDSNSRDRMEVREKGHKQRAKSANKKRRKSGDRKGHGSKAGGGTHHMTCEKLQKVKDTVEKAIRDHKTFTVQGSFPTIREAMKQRGWVEKEMHRYRLNPLDDSTYTVPFYASLTDLRNTESMLVARLLRSTKVDFLWTMRSEPIDWQDVHKKQLINRFPRAYFTTKVGLCAYLQNMHWFCENGVSHILFPRCYNVCHPEEMTAFIDDFRLTACLGLLKWLISKYEKDGETSIKSIEGKVPFTAVEFAIQRCNEYIGIQSHDDIDKFDNLSIWDHQWDQFLTWYYLAVHQDFLLMDCRRPAVRELYESAKKTLHDIRKFWPQLDLDGMGNIWIVKPGAKSRGRGIQLTNKLDKVMEKVNPATMKECRYVVQKYIGQC